MATTENAATTGNLQELAKRHLWLHYARMGAYDQGADIPVLVRGEGCHVWDEHGNRYFDGLSALFCVNIGHGRADIAQAGADQAKELGFFTNWSYAHPPAIELAAKIASLAPGDLNRVFFTSGGSEAVESAIKLVRQYHKLTGNPNKTKIIARETAYHGTTLGRDHRHGHHQPARAVRAVHARRLPRPEHEPRTASSPATAPRTSPTSIAERIEFEGPETVAAVFLEPVQNAGGCFVPPEGYFQRVREICDEYNVLFVSDEVICSWGRLGHWFGAQRYEYQPDIITTAKGLTSAYAPLGAVIADDRLIEPFLQGTASFAHGFTFGGHPICCAVALANIQAFEDEGDQRERPRERARVPRDARRPARHPDRRRRARRRLLPRARARQEPRDEGVLQPARSPSRSCAASSAPSCSSAGSSAAPTIAATRSCSSRRRSISGPAEFEEIESVLRPVLTEAAERMHVGG